MAHTKKKKTPVRVEAEVLLNQLTSRPLVHCEDGGIDIVQDELNCLEIIEKFLEKYTERIK